MDPFLSNTAFRFSYVMTYDLNILKTTRLIFSMSNQINWITNSLSIDITIVEGNLLGYGKIQGQSSKMPIANLVLFLNKAYV